MNVKDNTKTWRFCLIILPCSAVFPFKRWKISWEMLRPTILCWFKAPKMFLLRSVSDFFSSTRRSSAARKTRKLSRLLGRKKILCHFSKIHKQFFLRFRTWKKWRVRQLEHWVIMEVLWELKIRWKNSEVTDKTIRSVINFNNFQRNFMLYELLLSINPTANWTNYQNNQETPPSRKNQEKNFSVRQARKGNSGNEAPRKRAIVFSFRRHVTNKKRRQRSSFMKDKVKQTFPPFFCFPLMSNQTEMSNACVNNSNTKRTRDNSTKLSTKNEGEPAIIQTLKEHKLCKQIKQTIRNMHLNTKYLVSYLHNLLGAMNKENTRLNRTLWYVETNRVFVLSC